MIARGSSTSYAPLRLRVGDVVEVRTREEILATLDQSGSLEGLPFMPEMLDFCGKRLTVLKRADKTCEWIQYRGLRRMKNTVHLEGTRCSGTAHGGCQARCQLFWKEAWLRRAPSSAPPRPSARPEKAVTCSEEALLAATRRQPGENSTEVLYRCQATELLKASTPLPSWDLRQYVRDLRSGNVSLRDLLKSLAWSLFRYSTEHLRGYRLQIWLFNKIQRLRGGTPFVMLAGERTRTPSQTLGLEPGELVEVKSVEEIMETLDPNARNRGLFFDKEMTPHCGGTYRVHSRISRIIDEASGRMTTLRGDCVMLEGVVCTGRYHKCCPRAIYQFWREIWLRRPSPDHRPASGPAG